MYIFLGINLLAVIGDRCAMLIMGKFGSLKSARVSYSNVMFSIHLSCTPRSGGSAIRRKYKTLLVPVNPDSH